MLVKTDVLFLLDNKYNDILYTITTIEFKSKIGTNYTIQ